MFLKDVEKKVLNIFNRDKTMKHTIGIWHQKATTGKYRNSQKVFKKCSSRSNKSFVEMGLVFAFIYHQC